MITFIIIYNTDTNFIYTINSLKKNYKDECEYIVITTNNENILDLGIKYTLIEKPKEKTLGEVLNRAVDGANNDICFIVKAGCYLTTEAIQSLKQNVFDEKVGVVAPRLNTFLETQHYKFPTEIEFHILRDSKKAYQDFYGEKILIKEFDDNIIVFDKENFKALDRFNGKLNRITEIYKDYILKNFNNQKTVALALDALVHSKNIINQKEYHDDISNYYLNSLQLAPKYDSSIKYEIVELIRESKDVPIKLLEIGCEAGYTLMSIKDKFNNATIRGMENDENYLKVQAPYINIENGNYIDLLDSIEDSSLDYIICGSVLEKLVDPWQLLRKCKSKLSKNGKLIASLPNAAHLSVISELLNGFFGYKNDGITNIDNLRFFTLNTAIRLFSDCGYIVKEISGVQDQINNYNEYINYLSKSTLINRELQQPLELETQYNVLHYNFICII